MSEKNYPSLTLSKREVIDHVLASEEIQLVKMGDLLLNVPEACVDGRGKEGIIGVPGGNAGELVLALTAIEESADGDLLPVFIQNFTQKYIQSLGKFYLHTRYSGNAKFI